MPRLSTSLAYTENGQGTDFLQFTFTPNDVGTFDDYYFNFAASGRDPLVKSRTDIDYTVRFGDLTPGAPHNITVFIRSGDVDSSVGTFYRFTSKYINLVLFFLFVCETSVCGYVR